MWIAVVLSCLSPEAESCNAAVNNKLFDTEEQCKEAVVDVRNFLNSNVNYARVGCIQVHLRGRKVEL